MTEPTTEAPRARPILTTRARLALRVLSDDDVARVHAAALELLGAEGAAAEAAAESAPSTFVLAGRVPEHDVTLGAGLVWLAAGAATAGPGGVPERVRRSRRRRLRAGDAGRPRRRRPARRRAARGRRARRPAAACGRRAGGARARALRRRHQQARDGGSPHVDRRGRGGRRDGRGRRRLRRRGAPPPAALALRRRRRAGRGARLRSRRSARRRGAGAGRRRRRRARPPVGALGGRGGAGPRSPDLGAARPPPRRCARRLCGRPGRGPRRAVPLRRRSRGRRRAGAGPSASLFQLAAAQLAAHVGLPLVAGGPPHHEPRARLAGLPAGRVRLDDYHRVGRRGDRRSRPARRRHRLQPPAVGHGRRDLQLERDGRRRHRGRRRDRRARRDQGRSASAATTSASATRAGT